MAISKTDIPFNYYNTLIQLTAVIQTSSYNQTFAIKLLQSNFYSLNRSLTFTIKLLFIKQVRCLILSAMTDRPWADR